MALFTWKDEYSVGVQLIDTQHKKLVDLLNSLHEAMAQGKGQNILGDILNQLALYTKTHFSTEEKYMQQFNYSNYTEHKKEHDDLIAQVTEIKTKYDSGQGLLTLKTMSFLKDWLTKHILGSDKAYAPCFKENKL